MYVIGTAGHVDHGKSVLVEALTGIDPDRLREEKERGMTIDLGFAWMTLPSGRDVSLVDVPGHERFIKNMLAGAGGVDMAMLVVAADEGVMPQTREHLAILDLLHIERGVLVVTKSDLVEPDFLELVSEDVRETVEGTTLEGSPLVAVSGITGDGLDDLRRVLDEQLAATAPKSDIGRPRLPIDRSFTVAGFGTVVTGTLLDGEFEVGQEVELLPGGKRARIRGLQHHKEQVERATPGPAHGRQPLRHREGRSATRPSARAAGDVAAHGRGRRPAAHCRGREARPEAQRGADAARRLGGGALPVAAARSAGACAGYAEGWAQLRLLEPVAVVKGDRFVLRTPNDTVAGGEIVDVHPQRHRRFHEPTLDALESRTGDDPLVAVLRQLEPASMQAVAAEMDLSQAELEATVETLAGEGSIVVLGDRAALGDRVALVTAEGFGELTSRGRVGR